MALDRSIDCLIEQDKNHHLLSFFPTYIDQTGIISVLDVVQDGCLIQTRQICHILHLVELWRVHLLRVRLGDGHLLARLLQLHLHVFAHLLLLTRRDKALLVVRHPYQLFGGPLRLRGGVVGEVAILHHQVLERLAVLLRGGRHLFAGPAVSSQGDDAMSPMDCVQQQFLVGMDEKRREEGKKRP